MLINMILQGKGGVGKSFCASLLTQHFIAAGTTPLCIDTDPVNATFAGYAAYDVQRVDIMQQGDINPRAFDRLVELLLAAGEESPDGVAVIDNGAATFVPLCAYMAANEVLSMLTDAGHHVRLHTVLTGGQALDDTVNGFISLASNFTDSDIVVWKNEFFGELARDGYGFEDSPLFKAHARRIHAVVTLPAVRKEFAASLEQMLSARHTFAEADTNPDYDVMTRQRLRLVWRKLSAQMEKAVL